MLRRVIQRHVHSHSGLLQGIDLSSYLDVNEIEGRNIKQYLNEIESNANSCIMKKEVYDCEEILCNIRSQAD